jgi:hypothetical protein
VMNIDVNNTVGLRKLSGARKARKYAIPQNIVPRLGFGRKGGSRDPISVDDLSVWILVEA